MKQSPKLKNIQENMQPGVFTAHGFLGSDNRTLKDILREDDSVVKNIGLTHRQIAERMQKFTDRGKDMPEITVTIENIYKITVDDHRGFIPCPFADNENEIKTNTKLFNMSSGKTVYWSDLNIHMIREHGFYEGKESFFRIEPVELAEILGLVQAEGKRR